MKEINYEVKLTINLMQTDSSEGYNKIIKNFNIELE